MFVFLVFALMILIVALVAGWLLALWLMFKYPVLSVPIAVYIGLVLWLGANDAQALTVYALILLAIWRLTHKPSFQRLVGQRLQSSWRRLWAYDPPLTRDRGAVTAGEARPAVAAQPEDPIGRVRTVG